MSARLPANVAEKMLDGLIKDDAFRELFEKNPRAALHKIGYDTPEADRDWKDRDPVLPLFRLKGGLASKEKLAAGRNAMLAKFRAHDPVGMSLTSSARAPALLPFGDFDVCCDD